MPNNPPLRPQHQPRTDPEAILLHRQHVDFLRPQPHEPLWQEARRTFIVMFCSFGTLWRAVVILLIMWLLGFLR